MARYGASSTSFTLGGRVDYLSLTLPGWRGVSLLGSRVVETSDWFRDRLTLKVGFDLLTSFWEDTWVGKSPFRLRFPIFS